MTLTWNRGKHWASLAGPALQDGSDHRVSHCAALSMLAESRTPLVSGAAVLVPRPGERWGTDAMHVLHVSVVG